MTMNNVNDRSRDIGPFVPALMMTCSYAVVKRSQRVR